MSLILERAAPTITPQLVNTGWRMSVTGKTYARMTHGHFAFTACYLTDG